VVRCYLLLAENFHPSGSSGAGRSQLDCPHPDDTPIPTADFANQARVP
jgi:hypothetical protein